MTVEAEIKRLKDQAFDALIKQDVKAHFDVFADDITYIQFNGKTIYKEELIKTTESYFDRIHSISTKYSVINSEHLEDCFVEELAQETSVMVRVFIFFLMEWKVKRRAVYTWRQIDERWKISSIEILSEIKSPGKKFGWYHSASQFSRQKES